VTSRFGGDRGRTCSHRENRTGADRRGLRHRCGPNDGGSSETCMMERGSNSLPWACVCGPCSCGGWYGKFGTGRAGDSRAWGGRSRDGGVYAAGDREQFGAGSQDGSRRSFSWGTGNADRVGCRSPPHWRPLPRRHGRRPACPERAGGARRKGGVAVSFRVRQGRCNPATDGKPRYFLSLYRRPVRRQQTKNITAERASATEGIKHLH
jgi:hypothetical protein